MRSRVISPIQNNICARCFHRCLFSTRPSHLSSSSHHQIPRSIPPAGTARLTTRALLTLQGSEAVPFLQGLISANLTSNRPSGFYTAFLNASGRVLHDVFIYSFSRHVSRLQDLGTIGREKTWGEGDEGFFIECDAQEVKALEKHLKKHKLRSKVQIRALDEGEWDVWSVWRKDDIWTQHDLVRDGGADGSGNNGDMPFSLVDARAPGMGKRVLLPRTSADRVQSILSGDQVIEEYGIESYMLRRMLRGVPEGQTEIIRETALPQESNIDFMGGIDFRKGCYVGQELTIRTHHTGVVRKRILPVQIYEPDEDVPLGWQPAGDKPTYDVEKGDKLELPPTGSNISRVGKKGRSAGKWLGGIGNIGLALCRLETMTDVILTGEGTMYQPDQQFQIVFGGGENEDSDQPREPQISKEVRVKAFVPDWIRNRIKEKDVRK